MKSYSIASALLNSAFVDFAESGVINKFNRNGKTILIYADYSALQIDNVTKCIDLVNGATSDAIEITARLLQLSEQEINDIPTYLRKNLLKYLRLYTK